MIRIGTQRSSGGDWIQVGIFAYENSINLPVAAGRQARR
jgi:hypothetical protein